MGERVRRACSMNMFNDELRCVALSHFGTPCPSPHGPSCVGPYSYALAHGTQCTRPAPWAISHNTHYAHMSHYGTRYTWQVFSKYRSRIVWLMFRVTCLVTRGRRCINQTRRRPSLGLSIGICPFASNFQIWPQFFGQFTKLYLGISTFDKGLATISHAKTHGVAYLQHEPPDFSPIVGLLSYVSMIALKIDLLRHICR